MPVTARLPGVCALDPRTPVLVGAGQYTQRDTSSGTSPLELMTHAVDAAVTDTGSNDILRRVGSVGVVDSFSWGSADPAALLAAEVGIQPTETLYTHTSGTSPIELLADCATRIQYGSLDAALITGGEAVKSLMSGRYSGGPKQPEGTAPSTMLGSDTEPNHAVEKSAELLLPVGFYPLFENAIRGAAGRDLGAHVDWLGKLWARFSEVAAKNPHAFNTEFPDADRIASADEGNRMVALPYRKLMTANIFVDQAAALVLCSVGTARELGIPSERWVFPHSTGLADERWFVTERPELHRSPALAASTGAVLGEAGLGIDDVALLDLYSCFPSAVQVAATELGVDLADESRPPTVTGGLTFAGGPGSNYVTHSLATLVGMLRACPTDHALATAVGWYLTKHAAVVLSGSPSGRPFTAHDLRGELKRAPSKPIVAGATGTAGVVTYTVMYARTGEPERAIVVAECPDGARTAVASTDQATIRAMLETDPLGGTVELTSDASFIPSM